MEQAVNFPKRNQNTIDLLITKQTIFYEQEYPCTWFRWPWQCNPAWSNLSSTGYKTDQEKDSQLENS